MRVPDEDVHLIQGDRLLYFLSQFSEGETYLHVVSEHSPIRGSILTQDIADVLGLKQNAYGDLILDLLPEETLRCYLKERYGDENFCALKDKRELWREQGL